MKPRFLVSLLVIVGTSSGQVTVGRAVAVANGAGSKISGPQRLLTWSEGVQVIEVAWKNLGKFDSAIDCSHLVNQVYELAGMPYPYATSNELYAGVDGFERVRIPQPADLIVWPGHVGLVVNPQEHSFYSSLNSGLKIDSYDSPTWRARGPARFFRVVVQNRAPIRTNDEVLAARANDTVDSPTEPPSATLKPMRKPGSVAATSTETVFLKWERPKKSAVQTAMLQAWGRTSDDRQERWQEASESVIVEALKIERISLSGGTGTIEAKIKSAARLSDEDMNIQPATTSVTFRVVRAQSGWKIDDSSGRMYLTGDAAVAVISEHLAHLARENSSRAEQAETAALLHSLLR